MLLLWRRLRQRTSRLHGELRAKGRSDRRGETRLHAEQALTIGVLLLTRAGEQWTTEREFQRRALRALHRRGVQLADGLDLGSVLPGTDGGR